VKILAHGFCLTLLLGISLAATGAEPVSTALTTPFSASQGPRLLGQVMGQGLSDDQDVNRLSTPLGSLWKLFVYSWLQTRDAAAGHEAGHEPPYRCEPGARHADDEYCCEPGESVARDQALQRSCGPYFEPQRLGLTAPDWARFWASLWPDNGSGQGVPSWLRQLDALRPETLVPVASLLDALQHVPDSARQAARQALLPNTLRDPSLLAALGSSPRFKTWSWFDAKGERIGGAAGWLADGSAFWFGAPGTSQHALQQHARWLAQAWRPSGRLDAAADEASQHVQPCVQVQLFARYPLQAIQPTPPDGLLPARPTPYTLHFVNGQQLSVPGGADNPLRLSHHPDPHMPQGRPELSAQWPLEDYIARVIDREGDARETAAAHALAVVARTWLRQNAEQDLSGCLRVEDSSQAQRVSPRPPSAAARQVAAFTAELVLEGPTPVRYHRDQGAPGVLSWLDAVAAHRSGEGMAEILHTSYPQLILRGWHQAASCQELPEAMQWLLERQARWRSRLRQVSGFEALQAPIKVCQLERGVPFAEPDQLRIHLREWWSREGRVTLIHEYLHLAFRHHPNGQDEALIERLAQQLVDS
jgi:uncharacterized protein YfaQ (DUF2300 family)